MTESNRSRDASDNGASPTPEWRPLQGELYFRSELARRPSRKKAPLVEELLDGFAEEKWPRSILNPFKDPIAAREQLKEAVRRLNDSLLVDTIRFHVGRDGMTAWWEDVEEKRRRARKMRIVKIE